MNFSDIFIRRPVLATVISLLILIFGLRSASLLQLRQFPKMQKSVITVTTIYPGASAELMQGFVTSKLQKSIATAEGIDCLTASSTQSVSTITAYIKLNYDTNVAMSEIMAKVSEVQNALPHDSNKPVVRKASGHGMALMYLAFNSTKMTTQQIADYVSRVVQPKLQTVEGVSAADLMGGPSYAMRIWLDTQKMSALNITAPEVAAALQSQNFQTAAGQIKGNYVLYNINVHSDLHDAEQFKQLVVREDNNALIRLGDIAKVELGADSYDSSVIFNGKTAVFIGIKGSPTANPLTVINSVKAMLPSLAANYPPQFEGKIVYDSTKYIRSSLHEVIRSIAEACLIVILVVFLFLGTLRTVTIPLVTIPLSLIGVCSLMLWMGYSLNLLTLLAMVLAIGLVVDDAIVVVENIYRHVEAGLSPYAAAMKGAREIMLPIIAMTTTLAAVYAPIGFLTGVTGSLFKEFAFTLAFAVVISGVIAITLSPMMCSKILNRKISDNPFVQKIDGFFEKIKNLYQEKLIEVLNYRSIVAVFAAIVLAECLVLAATTKTELASHEDQSVIFSSATAPAYANIDYLQKFTQQFNDVFKSIPETQDYFIINGQGAPNNAIAGLILKPWNKRERSQNQVLPDFQKGIAKIAGLNAVAFPLPSIPGAGGGSLPVEFILTTTDDYLVLNQSIERLKDAAQKSGLFLYVDSNLKFEQPELQIEIDRDKAEAMGVRINDIGNSLSLLLGGNALTRFNIEGQSYDVIPQVPRAFRLNPDKINDIYIPAGQNGDSIPLSSVVNLKMTVTPNSLNQFQQLNSATLQALPVPGKSIPECLAFLKNAAKNILPEGVTIDFGGQSRQVMQEGNAMVYTFFFAILIIYLVLAVQFESFRDPLIVLISVPMSIAGALIPLNLGFATLNIYSGIGLVTLIGLISKHGILMVDFANKLQAKEGLGIKDAIIKSASIRLRPILMTTAAMVLGVLPLIMASGAGKNSRHDIGLVIACGMLIGTCFTLFVVPAMYTFFAKKHHADEMIVDEIIAKAKEAVH